MRSRSDEVPEGCELTATMLRRQLFGFGPWATRLVVLVFLVLGGMYLSPCTKADPMFVVCGLGCVSAGVFHLSIDLVRMRRLFTKMLLQLEGGRAGAAQRPSLE